LYCTREKENLELDYADFNALNKFEVFNVAVIIPGISTPDVVHYLFNNRIDPYHMSILK
jgi:hypothetical protein